MPTFEALFGRAPDAVATAPGRVNLLGEHTDYNDGLVLPTAVPQHTAVALARARDDWVRVASASVAEGAVNAYRLGGETRTDTWLDYVQGCTRMLAERASLGGFDALVTSSLPLGGGLASSAALEVALLRALRTAFALVLDDVALALVAHRAEHDFVGARVGVMDQMAASLADGRTALFLDARSLAHESVALPASLALLVIDSGIAHRHAGGDYNARRAECERAAALLGVRALRDVHADDLARVAGLPAALTRRVRHVVHENARVRDGVAALRAADLPALGALFLASHASLRDDFEVSLPELDALVDIAAPSPRCTAPGSPAAASAARWSSRRAPTRPRTPPDASPAPTARAPALPAAFSSPRPEGSAQLSSRGSGTWRRVGSGGGRFACPRRDP